MDPGPSAIGTWSGGRFMSFGEPLDDGRLRALLRPGDGTDTVITADAYGAGEADRALGEALAGIDREDYCLVGAIGHDFYEGAREGAKGYPRFTDPRLRQESAYADYIRMATERSLERCGAERFDLLLLHNPDRRGYQSAAVWGGLERVRPIAEHHQLTMLQLACAWNLAHEPVRCAAPTLIQERGASVRAVEDKRAELAAFARALAARPSAQPDGADVGPGSGILSAEEVQAIRAIGDNSGCMALKGASPEHAGAEAPDRWQLDPSLAAVAARWEIDPQLDLRRREHATL